MAAKNQRPDRGVQFGLLHFSSGEETSLQNKYRLVIEGARFADQHGFSAVWVPERHFTQVGCLFPNPSVIHAALARETKQIHLRAGSVVVPLHNPIRIAEEWAVVDNLSNGRVGLSFASGWHPDDFVFGPEKYAQRHDEMYKGIEIVRHLWEGGAFKSQGGDGNLAEIRAYPTPVQKTLPFWVTAAGNPKTFIRAGEMGGHLLTHLFNQSVEEAAEKIALYRKARVEHGFDPATAHVAIMVHTFIGPDAAWVNEHVRGPFMRYLESSADLIKAIAFSQGQKFDIADLSDVDREFFLKMAYDRLLADRVLFGTPETCFPLVERLRAIGVDEIACQMDFGVDTDLVLQSLPHLNRLKQRCDKAWGPALVPSGGPPLLVPGKPVTLTAAAPSKAAPAASAVAGKRPADIQARCPDQLRGGDFYARLGEQGVQFPSAFLGIEQLWRGTGEALGRVRMPEAANWEVNKLHPTVLDLCLQVLLGTMPADDLAAGGNALIIPGGLRGFKVHHRPGPECFCHAVARPVPGKSDVIEGDIQLLDESGTALVDINGLRLQRVPRAGQRPPEAKLAHLDWFYELQWEMLESPSIEAKASGPASWLICADRDGVGGRLAELLRARGDDCTLAQAGETAIESLVKKAATSKKPLRGVIHLWGLNAAKLTETTVASLQADQEQGVGAVVALVQALLKGQAKESPRLWIATRGAQPVGAPAPLALAQSPLWGLGRTIANESPEHWGGLIDLDPIGAVDEAAAQLLGTIGGADHEDQVAFRRGRRYGVRLERRRQAAAVSKKLTVHADGSYLITGGLGGMGLELAGWLVGLGARHLILVGRTPLPPRPRWAAVERGSAAARQIDAIRALESQGATVRVEALDVADEAAVRELLAAHARDGGQPIRGVIHSAGLWQDRALPELDPASLHLVLRSKVLGGWLLHRLLAGAPLDFFVMFSSAASLLPVPGQGNYAAANAFLDALAHHRRAEGRPALAINWGPWSDVGFGATADGQKSHSVLELQGIYRIAPKEGLEALKTALELDPVQVGILRLDWSRLLQAFAALAERPLLARLAHEERQTSQPGQPAVKAKPREKKGFMAPRNELEQYLVKQWQEILSVEKIGVYDNFFALGGHSIKAAVLANKLQERMGEKVHIVSFFDAPTVADLAVYLNDRYPQGMAKLLGKESHDSATKKAGKIAAPEIDLIKRIIATSPYFSRETRATTPKNPPAIFVLSPPRSGSTLFRVMLGGHPQLFSPPELGLLSFQNLADRNVAFSGRNSYRLQGTDRALREIFGWEEEEARRFTEKCEVEGWTTQRMYGYMQEALKGKILVDKTPNYAIDMQTLRRGELFFENAYYIHLLRHPYGMIRSFEEGHMDALFPSEHPFNARELGEIIWYITNQNIVDFVKEVPPERHCQVRYEDVVKDPQKGAEEICRFLHIDFHPEMVDPYRDNEKRMTDGQGHLGDPYFHKHKGIDANRADRWAEFYKEDFLGDLTWGLAESLGYPRRTLAAVETARPSGAEQIITNLAGASESEVDALLKSMLESEARQR